MVDRAAGWPPTRVDHHRAVQAPRAWFTYVWLPALGDGWRAVEGTGDASGDFANPGVITGPMQSRGDGAVRVGGGRRFRAVSRRGASPLGSRAWLGGMPDA